MSIKAKTLYSAGKIFWRLFKPVTMGVRVLLVKDNDVVLVKHSYQPHWYLPGGGIKKQETLMAVARREAWEEVGAKLSDLHFWGIYTNLNQYKSDHIIVFLCQDFVIEGVPDYEIERVECFQFDQLPSNVSPGSRRRIEEYTRGNHEPDVAVW